MNAVQLIKDFYRQYDCISCYGMNCGCSDLFIAIIQMLEEQGEL